MPLSFATFLAAVVPVVKMGLPVLLRARHGVGKSCLVYQIAETLGLPVIERRASQMTEGDLLGLPKVDGEVTTWLPPDWLWKACQEPVVLFIDEIDRGTLEVRQGFFELTDSRKIAGHHLHAGTKIFAAINGGEHGAQYSVNTMDPAELDRWVTFDLEPTTEDWLEWGRKAGISKMVLDFIAECPKHLEHDQDFEPNKVYPSRRSWHRMDSALRGSRFLEAGNPDPSLLHVAIGFVGMEAGIALVEYVRKYQKDLSAEDIFDRFDKPEVAKMVKEFSNVEFNSMNEKIKNSDLFKADWSDDRVENFCSYFKMIPSEIAVPFMQEIGKANDRNVVKFAKSVTWYMTELFTKKDPPPAPEKSKGKGKKA